MKEKLPLLLAVILYLLIYFIRAQQGGWDIKTDLFLSFRQDLDQQISTFLPTPQSQLLSGILLGAKKDLPGPLKLALRDTSTLHIVVVSGQNLTMLAAVFLYLAGIFSRRVAISFSLAAVLFYTILTGAQIPVLRAAVMFVLSSLAVVSGRQRDSVWILMITAGLMLLVNPAWIKELSFELSFMATLGVVAVAPILLKYLEFLPRFISQDLAVTVSAQMLVIPIIAQSFHQFSLVGIITNLLVGWTIPPIMILGTILLATSYLSITLAGWVGILTNVFLTYFVYIVQFFSSLPFAWEYVGEQVWVVWAGYYLIIAGILIAMRQKDGR